MDRNEKVSKALEELSRVINRTIEDSPTVREVVEELRQLGFEPNLSMRLEVALEEIPEESNEISIEEPELELTDDDIRALRRMRIAV